MTGHDPNLFLTQHWRIIDGAIYRDAWMRDGGGCWRAVSILDTDQ